MKQTTVKIYPEIQIQKGLWANQKILSDFDQKLQRLAQKAPGIKKIWKITQKLPSLTALICKERDTE